MSVIDWVKHSLPMKLKDGKRHVFPTLASMVYLKDGTTPITDGNGNWNADKALDAEKLGGHEPSHYETAIDATLKNSGEAADAKVTGDMLDQLSEQIANYRTAVNLLDNSDFTNLVAQAGKNGYHGNTCYVADRWINTSASPANFDTDGLVVDGATDIVQMLEKYSTMEGKTYTIAVKTLSGLYCTSFVMGAVPHGIRFSDYIYFFSVPSQHILFRQTGWNKYIWAALYEGAHTVETLPPYVPKGYAAELAECQRYYRKSFEGSTVPSYSDGAVIVRAANENWLCSTNFEKPMCRIPTVTLYNPITKTEGAVMVWSTDVDIVGLTVTASNTGFAITKTGAFDMNDAYCFHYIASVNL